MAIRGGVPLIQADVMTGWCIVMEMVGGSSLGQSLTGNGQSRMRGDSRILRSVGIAYLPKEQVISPKSSRRPIY
jgi:hypothetical protein